VQIVIEIVIDGTKNSPSEPKADGAKSFIPNTA
jgi:hypothetical protein